MNLHESLITDNIFPPQLKAGNVTLECHRTICTTEIDLSHCDYYDSVKELSLGIRVNPQSGPAE